MSYHKTELEKLKDTEYNKTIVLSDGFDGKTKYLDINLESIPVLIQFLKNEKKRITKTLKKG